MNSSHTFLCSSVLGLLFSTQAMAASITSTFDIDADGWLVSGDATSGVPDYVASGGNPGGFIEADDTVSGGVWYFQAPGKFLGDMSGAYGQTLSFDLTQDGRGSQFSASDIILDGGGIQITLDSLANPLPLGDWVSYAVVLDESDSWMNGGIAATQSDIQTVLGALTRLRIRGEYISGSDTGGLDNVNLQVVPVPAAVWLFASALVGLVSTRKQ